MQRFTQFRPLAGSLSLAAAIGLLAASVTLLGAQPAQPGGQAPQGGQQGQGQRPQPGQQAGQPRPGSQTAAPETPRPIVPVAASSVIKFPDRFVGETVTLTGVVDQALSTTTFTVDQDAKTASGTNAVLVIARRPLNARIKENEYVTVVGDLIKYDPAVVAKRRDPAFDTQLPPEATAAYVGRPVILATTVFQGSEDLAMRLPPPMTPAEQAFQKVMLQVGPANGAFRKAMAGANADQVREQLGVLRNAFTETEAFFKTHRVAEAVKFAQDARRIVEAADKAAVAANWAAVKAEADNLAKMCQTCHNTYRDRYDDGSFRVKLPGTGN